MLRDWFWQLAAAAQGPDWLFTATFAPADTTRLALSVRQHPPPGFVYHRVASSACHLHPQPHAYDCYVDAHNADALIANLAGQPARNLWVYHTIEVCGPHVSIERGYGGYPGAHGPAETSVIWMLAQAPDLSLATWEIAYGGQGYQGGQLAQGTSATSLCAYLKSDA